LPQTFGALGQWQGIIVGVVVDFPAKGIERNHRTALDLGEQEKGGCQIGAAFCRNQLTLRNLRH
jgi:hypothetical protein